MPYVQMPKDLTKVKTKVAFNLTKRQIICFGLAAVCAVPTYFLTRETIGNNRRCQEPCSRLDLGV